MQHILIFLKTIPVSFAALAPVINPIGTAIIILGLTQGIDSDTRKVLSKKIAINMVIFLTVLLVGGSYILSVFGISVPIVQTAGGLILASMGWKWINQPEDTHEKKSQEVVQQDPQTYLSKTFYPYTFPITVGPGAVAVTLTLSAHTLHGDFVTTLVGQAGVFLGILANGFLIYLSLSYSNKIAARIGPTGLSVMLRLVAFIIVCIGAEICWTGVSALMSQR
jgi:multiple antibiotic resistance protein